MKRLLLVALLIVGCVAPPPSGERIPNSTVTVRHDDERGNTCYFSRVNAGWAISCVADHD